MKLKILASCMFTGMVTIGGNVMAGPMLLNEAQMDQVVAGAIFTDTVTTTSTSTEWYHGYSNTPAAPNAPGASSAQVTHTVVTQRTLDCPGNSINSCYAGGQSDSLNPQTNVTNSVVISDTTTKTLLSGPGNSFANR